MLRHSILVVEQNELEGERKVRLLACGLVCFRIGSDLKGR